MSVWYNCVMIFMRIHYKLLLIILLALSLLMGLYIVLVYKKTSRIYTSASRTAETKNKPEGSAENAFIQLGKTEAAVNRGGKWRVEITTNTWAKCMVDLYRPQGDVYPLETQAAQAKFVSPGAYTWYWQIPTEADSGKWVARIICGTFENLATADQAIEVE